MTHVGKIVCSSEFPRGGDAPRRGRGRGAHREAPGPVRRQRRGGLGTPAFLMVSVGQDGTW